MRRLRQQPLTLHQKTKVPSGPPLLRFSLINDHAVEQSAPADDLDEGRVEGAQLGAENVAQAGGALREILAHQDVEGGDGYGAAERVAESRQMRPWD
jgi:hypothetical protein